MREEDQAAPEPSSPSPSGRLMPLSLSQPASSQPSVSETSPSGNPSTEVERLRAEVRHLAAERDFLARMLDNAQFGAAYLDRDLVFRYCSAVSAGHLGLVADVVGRSAQEVVAGNPRALDALRRAADTGEPQSLLAFPVKHPHRSEMGEHHYSVSLVPDKDDSGVVRGVFVTGHEVTEQVRAERDLRQNVEHLYRAIDEFPLPEAIIEPGGRFLRVNDAFCRLAHRSRDELMSLSVRDIVPLDDYGTVATMFTRLIDGESGSCQLEKDFSRPNGERIWLRVWMHLVRDSSGSPLFFLTSVEDTTRSMRAEEEHARALAELDAIFGAIPTGVVVYGPRGEIVRANPEAQRIFGYTEEQARLPMQERLALIDVRSSEGASVKWEDSLAWRAVNGETIQRVRQYVRSSTGTTTWVVSTAAPVRMPDGRLLGAVLNMVDITAVHKLQEQQEDYLRMVSHDLRSPLTAIKGSAEWLRGRLGDRPDLSAERTGADIIYRSASRMNAMIQDLVDCARLETGQLPMDLKATDLERLVGDLIGTVGSPQDQERVRLDVPEPLPPVAVDGRRLERAIINLMTNALKYSAPDLPVVVRLQAAGERAIISVVDRGVGIMPDELPRIFDRFYRAKSGRKAEGLGLGLYIARLIVEAHKGCIWAESAPGEGSAFSIALPVSR